MSFLAFILTGTTTGIPVWLFGLAMVCDTVIVVTAMSLGLFS